MDEADNGDFTNCDDLTDSDIEESDDDDEQPNLNSSLRDELEILLLRMFELVQECYVHLMHPSISCIPIPQRTSMLTGAMWVHWVLTDDNQTTCYERFRMGPSTFLKLCNTLKQNGFLKSSRYVKITEQVATFLLIATHSHTHRDVSDRIQRSTETVNRYCHLVSKALCRLGKIIIRPSTMQVPHPYVMTDSRYYSWFGKCIGAIDGTHVDANVTGENKVPYRDYKSNVSQNVLCIVDFDLCFTYVYAGWEGSTHDSRVFWECIHDPKVRFPTPTEEYFYLVDSGYGCYKGFLTPHRNERYHQETFRQSRIPPQNAMEFFNYRHSSLRSVVERSFGILKKRFKILKCMLPFSMRYQRYFVIACCTVHNFIRKDCGLTDPLFVKALSKIYGQEWIDVSQVTTMPPVPYVARNVPPDRSRESKEFMVIYRDAVTSHMWQTVNSG